jgi:hypothetical protein
MSAGSPMAMVVIAVNMRVLLQFFPLSLPFALSFLTLSCFAPIRASPPVLGMSPCTLKSDQEKSTHAIWLRKIVFVYLLNLVSLVNGAWYVTLHIKIREREVNIRQFGSGKCFSSCIFAEFGEAGE